MKVYVRQHRPEPSFKMPFKSANSRISQPRHNEYAYAYRTARIVLRADDKC